MKRDPQTNTETTLLPGMRKKIKKIGPVCSYSTLKPKPLLRRTIFLQLLTYLSLIHI